MPADPTMIGHLRARQQPDQRRLACTVDAEDAVIVPGQERGRRVLQDDLAAAVHRVSLGDVVEGDHNGSRSRGGMARSKTSTAGNGGIAKLSREQRSSRS